MNAILASLRRLLAGAYEAFRKLEEIEFDAPWRRNRGRC